MGYRRYAPIIVADRLGFGQEIGFRSGIEPLLQVGAARQKPLSLGAEFPFELNGKGNSIGGKHSLVTRLDRAADGDAWWRAGGFGHADISRSTYLPSATQEPPTPKPPSSVPAVSRSEPFAVLR